MRHRSRQFTLGGVALGAAVAAAGAALVAPIAAHADGQACSTPIATCAGKATFTSEGEVFRLYDEKPDGRYSALLYWLSDGSGPYLVWNKNTAAGDPVVVNLSLREGDWIYYRTCLGEPDSKAVLDRQTCGEGVTDYA